MNKRIIFMGSPDFATPALQALIDSPHEVVAVYCQPPRPSGRGHKVKPGPVHLLAESHHIPVHTPVSLKDEAAQTQFASYAADFAVVAAYGLLLPQAILDAPKHGCINIHPSDLPRWRGAAPLHHTIMAGDTTTAMCIMQMDAGLDTGDVLWRQAMDIPSEMNTAELHDIMADLGARAILEVIADYENITAQPQTGDATYASKIKPADTMLDLSMSVREVLNKIRGLSPFPGAKFEWRGETLKAFAAQPCDQPQGALTMACADGHIRMTEIQRAGKPRMAAEDFLRGLRD